MTDETLRAASINNEFLRALGELVIAGARLEQLDLRPVEPADPDSRIPLWVQRAQEMLDERDRFIRAVGVAAEGSTVIRVTARDGSVIAGDAIYIVHLATRLTRHRGAGIAMGVSPATGFVSTATGPMPVPEAADAG
jgi:hypothetical protein